MIKKIIIFCIILIVLLILIILYWYHTNNKIINIELNQNYIFYCNAIKILLNLVNGIPNNITKIDKNYGVYYQNIINKEWSKYYPHSNILIQSITNNINEIYKGFGKFGTTFKKFFGVFNHS